MWLRRLLSSPTQLISAGAISSWGLQLLNPWLDDSSGRVYLALSALAPEWFWGSVFVSAGALWLAGLCCDRPRVAIVGATLTIGCRLMMLVLTGITTGWTAAGIPDFAWWVVLALVGDWRRRSGSSS